MKEAKNATDKLLKEILSLNKKLNPGGRGCWIENISITYDLNDTRMSVEFKTNSGDVDSFVCSSIQD